MEKLNVFEMQEVVGGKVCTREEYCAKLVVCIASRASEGDWETWRIGDDFLNKYCN